MAQNITLLGASYPNVPSVVLPKTGGGNASFVDVSGASLSSSDGAKILAGESAFGSDGKLIAGQMANNGAVSGSITTKAGTVTVPAGYTSGGTVGISATEQAKIISENIKSGVTLLGQPGSLLDYNDYPLTVVSFTKTITTAGLSITLDPVDLNGRDLQLLIIHSASFSEILKTSTTYTRRLSMAVFYRNTNHVLTSRSSYLYHARNSSQSNARASSYIDAIKIYNIEQLATGGAYVKNDSTDVGQFEANVVYTFIACG